MINVFTARTFNFNISNATTFAVSYQGPSILDDCFPPFLTTDVFLFGTSGIYVATDIPVRSKFKCMKSIYIDLQEQIPRDL